MKINGPGAVAAIVVIFYPDNDFEDRLDAVIRQVGKVIVVDNTPGQNTALLLSRLSAKGCHIINNEFNLGVATALNQGITWAAQRGFEWVLTLDQDSRVHDGLIALYINALNADLVDQRVGVLNSRYLDINTGTLGVSFSGRKVGEWMDVEALITSGSFFSMATYKLVGPLRDDFLLDWADHDFCLRARAKGLRNFICERPYLDHALGSKTEHKLFGGMVTLLTNNHSPMRCYLIGRNLVILLKENFFRELHWSLFLSVYLVSKFVLVTCFEKDKLKKLHNLARGVTSGILHKPNDITILNKQG